jgi:hypothetical protein
MHSNKEEFLTLLRKLEEKKQSCSLILKIPTQDSLDWLNTHYPHAFILSLETIELELAHQHIMHFVRNLSIHDRWLFVEQAERLNLEQQSILNSFLSTITTQYHIIFITDAPGKNLHLLKKEAFFWTVHSQTPEIKKETLRTLLIPHFKELPKKDDKILLTQLPVFINALAQEINEIETDELKKLYLTLLDTLLSLLHSPLQGQMLARAIKWSCYRYLKGRKLAAQQTL